MSLSHHDELLLQRHFDGELEPAAEQALRSRLAAEPELARAAAAAQALRAGFAAARQVADRAQARPSSAFTAHLLQAVRQLPSRQQLEQADVAASAVRMCRNILLAALLIAGLGLLWQAGLVGRPGPTTLQAGPADVQRLIEELDAQPRPDGRAATRDSR